MRLILEILDSINTVWDMNILTDTFLGDEQDISQIMCKFLSLDKDVLRMPYHRNTWYFLRIVYSLNFLVYSLHLILEYLIGSLIGIISQITKYKIYTI